MTIQVSVMNGYGLAMASDRHVFRGGEARSSGEDVKVVPLRGDVPAALMAAGPFAMFNLPVARLAFRLERALAHARAQEAPEALADSVLDALTRPLDGPRDGPGPAEWDVELLAEITEQLVTRVLGGDAADGAPASLDGRIALPFEAALAGYARPDRGDSGRLPADMDDRLIRLMGELAAQPACRDRETVELLGRAAWDASFTAVRARLGRPLIANALDRMPELCGHAVVAALGRDWRKASELFLTVGLCCPSTGVPVIVALRGWRGIGRRLHFASRLDRDYEAAWRAGRTVLTAQGSGAALVEAMVDGMTEDHWGELAEPARERARRTLDRRWDRAHQTLAVSSPEELCRIAAGLVRGAEVVGYLMREGERSMVTIDTVAISPRGLRVHSSDMTPSRDLAT